MCSDHEKPVKYGCVRKRVKIAYNSGRTRLEDNAVVTFGGKYLMETFVDHDARHVRTGEGMFEQDRSSDDVLRGDQDVSPSVWVTFDAL